MRRELKSALWVVAGVFVLVVLLWWVGKTETFVREPGTSLSPTVSAAPRVSVRKTPTPTPSPTPAPVGSALPETYNQALVKYANRRMQFDVYCQAQPSSLSIQHGSAIMLDNRSGDSRTFAVGGAFFTIPGYGWRIHTPSAATYPATLKIDCGSARNVGTLILQ